MTTKIIALPDPPEATLEHVAVCLLHILGQQLRHGCPDNWPPVVASATVVAISWADRLAGQGIFAEPTPAPVADYFDTSMKLIHRGYAEAKGEEPPDWLNRPLSDFSPATYNEDGEADS